MPAYTFLSQPPAGVWNTAGSTKFDPTQSQTIFTTINTTGGDQTAQINTAIANAAAAASAASPRVVKLGAGTFRIDGLIKWNNSITLYENVILRGSGKGTTILDCRGLSTSGGLYMGYGGNSTGGVAFSQPTSNNTVTAGGTVGSTTITIADTSAFTVGNLLSITLSNQQDNTAITAGAVPVFKISTGGLTELSKQRCRLISKTSTTLTFDTPLCLDSSGGLTMKVYFCDLVNHNSGVEDLTVDCTNGTAFTGIWMEQCENCWLYNTRFTMASNFNIYWLNGANLLMTYSQSDTLNGSGGPNGAGLLVEGSGHWLVYDNIFYTCVPHFEVNFGCVGYVIAYNFGTDVTTGGISGAGIDTNHGPHNRFNLIEGNVSPNFEADGFFGSVSEDTVFRNWFSSVSTPGVTIQPMRLKRMTRRYQVIGNLLGTNGVNVTTYDLGTPNIGNTSSTGTAQPTAGDFWIDWANSFPAPPDGKYQELDLDVQASSTFKGNYNTQDDAIPAGESLAGDTLPNSLYLSSKPSWFYGLAWPAFDSSSPVFSAQRIPAGYRYFNGGTNPPAGGGSSFSTKRIGRYLRIWGPSL